MSADRYDSGKPELDYCDSFPVALEGVAKVSMSGRAKYTLFNYAKGAKSARESYNCARRHMLAWYNGQDWVPDAAPGIQVHELDAAIWNLMRLRQELVTFPERDDRPHMVLAHPERAELTARKAAAPFAEAAEPEPCKIRGAGLRCSMCDKSEERRRTDAIAQCLERVVTGVPK